MHESNGRYRVKFRGKSIWFPRGTKKAAVEDFEAKLRLGQVTGEYGSDIGFSSMWEIWLLNYGNKYKVGSSLAKDRATYKNHLESWFGDLRLSEISTQYVIQFQTSLVGKYAPQSINNIMSLLSGILRFAVEMGFLGSNPVSGLRRIKRVERDPTFWTFDEKARFLSWSRVHDPKLYTLCAFTLSTGLRPGELQALMRECLDYKYGFVLVNKTYCHRSKKIEPRTKGKKNRRIPLSPALLSILGQFRGLDSGDLIFPYSMNSLGTRWLKPACEEAHVKVIRLHDLRHTFATHLIMRGVHVVKVKELLGHTKLETTMKYVHMVDESLKGVTDILDSDLEIAENDSMNVIAIGNRIRSPGLPRGYE